VKILTGELNPRCYENPEFIRISERLLANGVNMKIIFHKSSPLEDAILKLKHENPGIIELKQKYNKILHLYWQQRRNPKHFAVVDENAIFAEEPHASGAPREVLVKESTLFLGKKASEKFDKIVEKECKEVYLL